MSVRTSILEDIGKRISGGTRNKKSFELLYKAIDKPDVDEFHRRCDAKGPTVTIIYGQFNTIFGGYTSKNWSSTKNRKMRDDDAFLFTKNDNDDEKCIFLPIKKDKVEMAITCDADFGPTFGGSTFKTFDLQAFKKDPKSESENKDDCMHLNGVLNVNCAYSVERNPGDDQQKIKTKDINSGHMVAKRIEVYQVIDDELPVNWLPQLEKEDFLRKKQELVEMETLPGFNIKQYNILLVGVIGSGKSSLVNTLSTVFTGKVRQIAPARNSETSVTSKVKDYILKSAEGEALQIRIFDIRGFEDERGYDHELELLLDGKLPVGYQFPDKPVPVPVKEETPTTLDEEIHLVCFVNGNSYFDTSTDGLQKRISDIKQILSKKDLQMVVVATKFDTLCPKIAQDVNHIHASPKAKNAALRIAEFYGVTTSQVFPVVNYVSQKETNDGLDSLALEALYEMIEVIVASLQHHQGMVNKPDDWAEREQLLPLRTATETIATLMTIHDKFTELGNKKLLILVVGPTKSGKSSFIDSLSSSLQHDKIETNAVGPCFTSAQHGDVSSTEKFQLYPMKCKHESGALTNTSVYFGDTPGFQETEGIKVDHVRFILRGNVPDKYKIINGIEETAMDFKADPTPGDRMHCVCCVFDCETIRNGLSENMKSTMKNVLRIVDTEGIPYVVILTKCDRVSKAVKENKRKVFEDRKVRECKNSLVETFGFKQTQIFPVVNYNEENYVDFRNDALLIAAFNQVLKIGKNKLEQHENEDGRPNEA